MQGNTDVWLLDGARTSRVTFDAAVDANAVWSPDGTRIVFRSNRTGQDDLYQKFTSGASGEERLVASDQVKNATNWSADGRFLLFLSVDPQTSSAGAAEAAAGGRWQVSTAGGIFPARRPDGKELYFINPAGAMMAAPIAVKGSTLEPGVPVVLFATRIVGGGVDAQYGRQYDVAPDGRVLINTELDRAAAPITLLMNWNPEVKK